VKIDSQILVYIALVIVAVAGAVAINLRLARSDPDRRNTAGTTFGSDSSAYFASLLRVLRFRSKVTGPVHRSELQDQFGVGIRVALLLTVVGLLAGAFVIGVFGPERDWWLAVIVFGLMVAPFLTILLSVAHTFIMRFLSVRGPVVSTAMGIVLGLLASLITRDEAFAKPFAIYGGAYGLIVWFRRVMPANPGLVSDARTDPDEEPPKAPLF
jgi:hypothetical protein